MVIGLKTPLSLVARMAEKKTMQTMLLVTDSMESNVAD